MIFVHFHLPSERASDREAYKWKGLAALLTFNVHSSSYEFYLASATAAWGVHTRLILFLFFVALRQVYENGISPNGCALRRGEKNATPVLCTTHSAPSLYLQQLVACRCLNWSLDVK
jgi:hypothetical protein